MSGLLSQTLVNLQSSEQQITSLPGLPPAASQVQAASAATIRAIVSETTQLQSLVSSFAQNATTKLNALQASLSTDGPSEIQAALLVVQSEINMLEPNVGTLVNNITAGINTINGYSNTLAGIEANLNSQVTPLQGQLNNAQSEEEATKKKYYFLLALGPLGLIGLAAALALYEYWTSQLNDLESQASALSSQISLLKMMNTATQQLGTDFQSLTTSISGVKNEVDFISGELTNIMGDLNNKAAIAIFIQAALTDISTMAMDAS